VDSSPAALDTLNELAAALGDDPNFATTVTNSIALKAPLASPSFPGDVDTSGLLKVGTNDSEYANNYIRFKSTGAAYIDHGTVGQAINFRVSGSSSLDTTPLSIDSTGIDVTGNLTMASGGSIVAGGANDLILNAGESGTPDIYLQSGSSTKVKIEGSNGNVGIAGQTNPTYKLDGGFADQTWGWYLNSSYNAGFTYNTTERSLLISTKSAENIDHIKFATGGAATERVRIDGAGNVALMTDGAELKLYYTEARKFISNSGPSVTIKQIDNHSTGAYIDFAAWDNSSLMRLMNSGDLLVGKTTDAFGTAGIALRGTVADFTRDGGTPINVNRLTSDGSLIDFHKASTVVGSIGNYGGLALDVGKGTTAVLRFRDSLNAIYPAAGIAGGTSDGVTSLGISSGRFKDLYLSGGVYLGGTGAANKLDDYEEGTWTPSLIPSGGTAPTLSLTTAGTYTKVGRLVTVIGYIQIDSISGTVSNAVNIANLPFNATINNGYMPAGSMNVNGITFANSPHGGISLYNQNRLAFLTAGNGTGWGWELFSIFSNGDAFRFSISYYAA